jgi:saccharopine dehydrogenase-like NADP-dependent oxidoreductase
MGRMDKNDAAGIPNVNKKGNAGNKPAQQIMASIDWTSYVKQFKAVPRENLVNAISSMVLQCFKGVDPGILSAYTDASARDSFIKTTTIQLMSTPEYQLC